MRRDVRRNMARAAGPAVRRDVLLDTGPIVATLDPRDPWHDQCVGAIERHADRCLTSEAVVTEACYFAARTGRSGAVVVDFLFDLGVPVVSVETGGLRTCARLMDRYADVPMDFADATLVALAEVFDITTVITTDRRGFATYRLATGGTFRAIPDGRR